MTEDEIKAWLSIKTCCDENGAIRDDYGNRIDLVKLIKDFVFEYVTKK